MVRTVIGSLGGAGAGFLAGFVVVLVVARVAMGEHCDTVPISLFVGVFLAGAGAIAGAVIGGVADLLANFRRKDQATRRT